MPVLTGFEHGKLSQFLPCKLCHWGTMWKTRMPTQIRGGQGCRHQHCSAFSCLILSGTEGTKSYTVILIFPCYITATQKHGKVIRISNKSWNYQWLLNFVKHIYIIFTLTHFRDEKVASSFHYCDSSSDSRSRSAWVPTMHKTTRLKSHYKLQWVDLITAISMENLFGGGACIT